MHLLCSSLRRRFIPACVETCVGGARVIGDIKDPNSHISHLMREHQNDIKVLKPEENTQPHVFYIGMDDAFTSNVDGKVAIYDPAGENA